MADKMVKILGRLIIVLLLFAMVLTGLLSFFAYYRYPQLLPSQPTFFFWKNVLFENALFPNALLTSVRVGVLSALLATGIGFMSGYGIVLLNWQSKNAVVLLYSLPLLIPITSLFIGVHMVMIALGLSSTLIGVVLAHALIGIPYAINIAISFFSGIPRELVMVAKTLGATKFMRFKHLILPLITPGIAFSLGMTFLISVSDYFATFLIGGGNVLTLSTIYYPLISNADYGHSSVLSIIFLLMNIMVFGVVDYLVKKTIHSEGYLYE